MHQRRDSAGTSAGNLGAAAWLLAAGIAGCGHGTPPAQPPAASAQPPAAPAPPLFPPAAAPQAPPPTSTVDGSGSAARFANPKGLSFDSAGNLFVADTQDHVIRRITPEGAVSTFAGMPGQAGHADGVGPSARFSSPHGVAIDAHDNLFVTDETDATIRRVTPAAEVSTIAGSAGHAGNLDGIGTAATFEYPLGITVDAADNLYVVAQSAVRKITRLGVVTTIAGRASAGAAAVARGYRDGKAMGALFQDPAGIAIDQRGNLFVVDSGNVVIRKISPAGVVTTIAGTAGRRGYADGKGAAAEFFLPTGIVIDANSNLYVTDCRAAMVRKIAPSRIVTTVARSGCAGGIAIGAQGALYVSVGGMGSTGRWSGAILKVSRSGGISTFAGRAP
jgi:sugar lactone lactonase YvrE